MNQSMRDRFIIEIPQASENFNDVCALQSVQSSPTGYYNAIFNGSLGNDFITHGYSRSVIISSSGDDLSNGDFIVSGLQNGAPVTTAPFAGPASGEAIDTGNLDPTYIFDTITSIQVKEDLLGSEFTAGSGYLVVSRPLFVNWSNPNTNFMAYGLSVRNPGEHNFTVCAAQVFTYGTNLITQAANTSTYGIYTLSAESADTDYLYRGVPGSASDGTAVSYPLWDAFFLLMDFSTPSVPDRNDISIKIAFPQIGR